MTLTFVYSSYKLTTAFQHSNRRAGGGGQTPNVSIYFVDNCLKNHETLLRVPVVQC